MIGEEPEGAAVFTEALVQIRLFVPAVFRAVYFVKG